MKSAEAYRVGAEATGQSKIAAHVAMPAETEAETSLGTKPESPLESEANRLRVARGGSKSAGSRPLEVQMRKWIGGGIKTIWRGCYWKQI